MTPHQEIERLRNPSPWSVPPPGWQLCCLEAWCPEGAWEVLSGCHQVLMPIFKAPPPSLQHCDPWRSRLPAWFVSACVPERPDVEDAEWLMWFRTLPESAQLRALLERPWPFQAWLSWMPPRDRNWRWWSAEIKDADRLNLQILIRSGARQLGTLSWLVQAAGGLRIHLPYAQRSCQIDAGEPKPWPFQSAPLKKQRALHSEGSVRD